MKVLILGGYGVFGGRLAGLLADEPRVTLIIAGRHLARAEAFCRSLPGDAQREPLEFDRSADLHKQLQPVQPDIVIDASGPFQAYGRDPYRLIRACVDLKINYMDLADGSSFVQSVANFDAEALDAGIFVLSGVSSFPVLTAAVVRALTADWHRVRRISAGIAPSPYAGVGLNVIRAIAAYAGKPVQIVRKGRVAMAPALIDAQRHTIAPPGRLPLHNIRFTLVDVPDLRVLPELWPDLDELWVGAGPVPALLHRLLSLLSWLVRLRLLRSLVWLAPLFHLVINNLRWGEHRGGMFVDVAGENRQGGAVRRSWHLLAEGDDGPLIPSMAAEALVRRCLDGRTPEPGARSGARALELRDYEWLFHKRTIVSGCREQEPAAAPLYQRVLGDAWLELPAAVRELHDVSVKRRFSGLVDVERGTGRLAALIAARFSLPPAGQAQPLSVEFEPHAGQETWSRRFGQHLFSSRQWAGQGRSEYLLCERIGPLVFHMALVLTNGRLNLVQRRWFCFGLPMPLALAPDGEVYEYEEGGRFHFHVEIRQRLIGLVVRYRGWLKADVS
jgi:hypothetical protein